MNGVNGKCEYTKQVLQGAKDVILSTKTMMLLVNEGTGNTDMFSHASSQVAADTKQLIVLMCNADSPVFSHQFLQDATKALKTYILNLIKASKDCVLNPTDTDMRATLDVWCRRVGEVLKAIMTEVQPNLPQSPQPPPIPTVPLQAFYSSTNTVNTTSSSTYNLSGITTSNTITETEDRDLSDGSDTSARNTVDEENDDMTGEFSGEEEEEEELDFVVNALNVYNSLEDLRGVAQKGFTVKRFHKAIQVLVSSAATLLDVSQSMNLSHSTTRLRMALEALIGQQRHLQSDSAVQESVLGSLEPTLRELEEAVGACVDEFRSSSSSSSSSLEVSVISSSRDIIETSPAPPSPRRKPMSRDDSFREVADKNTVFGLPLEIVLKNQKNQFPSLQVPIFFRDAVNYLRREGLEASNLFKVQLSTEKIHPIINRINSGYRVEFGGSDCDAYVTANLIKRFLSALPTPLCVGGKSSPSGGSTSVHEVQGLVQGLPAANQHLLSELCALLYQVSLHAQYNHMPTDALATAVGPFMFASPNISTFPWHSHNVVCLMIERFQDIFKQYPSRADFPMIRSASDITPKGSLPAPPPATFSTPQLRPRTAPVEKKKKNYFRLPRSGTRRLPTPPYKICVVGETAVGKTALIHRLLKEEFIDYHEATVEQRFESTQVLEGDVYSLEMMDTSGSHIDNLAYQKWFEWGEGFIIVIDITSSKSFEQVQYWLDEIARVRSSPHPFLLVGSHMDEELGRSCQRDMVETFLKPLNATYVEYSAKYPAVKSQKILTIIINEIHNCRKQKLEIEKTKAPKKGHYSRSSRQKPKREEPEPQSQSHPPHLSNSGDTDSSAKEKRRKPTPPPVDNWASRAAVSEGWIETEQEKALAQLGLPGSNGVENRSLINMDCVAQGFTVELSRESVTSMYPEAPLHSVVAPVLRYYRPNFVGKEHSNYVGDEVGTDGGKVIVSFLLAPLSISGDDADWGKAIVRTKKEDHRILVPYGSRKDMLKAVVKAIPSLQVHKWQEIKDPSLVESLANFEETMGQQVKHKFGVLLCLDGQTDENQMFGNKDSTPELDQFLSMLGDKITLQGWTKFRGGLDVNVNSTGLHSYYTEFQGTEIMFHVSTLLPFQDDDIQRVERKRHIGNDIVTIIFKSGNEPFSPTIINTKFTHVFCVVSLEKYDEAGTPHYRIALANKPQIKPYPPFFPPSSPPVFERGPNFRSFLLSKLINGERSALQSPEFRTKLVRTRKSLLQELAGDKVGK